MITARFAPALAALCLISSPLTAQISPKLFDSLAWRFIGPFRGGRVLAVSGVPGNDHTFYFGAVGGGAWKTTDAGTVWSPIFDSEHIASIGAIAVAPSDPNVIYTGTGEADMRSDISFGDGVYKSTDAGKTWKNIGLRDSRQISRILVDPRNPDLVYVAALGHAYGPNAERGVYRSGDGGRTWRKVLDKGPETGAADLSIDPENPKLLYATMWHSRRPPWSQYAPIEGPGSGLFKSSDGGDTWTQIAGNGLPEIGWGRSGVAIAPGTGGRRVYALIDAKNAGGLFRSDDGGASWKRVSADTRITSRAWYFSGITVDPRNPDIVYIPNVALYTSRDGGATFQVLKGAPGGDDYHSLWIDPADSSRMILGSDQGTNISIDGGKTWTTWYNQPTAQMYHVATDNRFPYWVYGSQQDSGTVALPSRTDHGIILEYDRRSVGGAESGYIAPDPKDPNILYVSNTYGTLTRFDRRTSQGQNITPWPAAAFGTEITQRKYRFPWTAPLVFSPSEPGALLYGSQVLLKTVDGGLHWTEISPDLTGAAPQKQAAAGPPTLENAKTRGYGVIYSIAPSPMNAALIWAGSDTGLIHLTRDGGKTWSNVTPKGLTDWSKVTHIEASHFDPAVAYAAVDRHRLDDYKPYLFRTGDYGKTWTQITAGIDEPAFLNAVREDPARKGLLFAATEMGVYVSFNDGGRWQPLQFNLPVTSVRDLVIHGSDLVIATHGRGFWIMDDISPLREAGEKVAASDVYLFKPATAVRMSPEGFQGTPFPPETPQARNPPAGAIIDYYLKSATEGEVTLEILDGKNEVVRRYSTKDQPRVRRSGLAIADIWIVPPPRLTATAGMNRFVWDLRYAGAAAAGEGEPGEGRGAGVGPLVLPGTYRVRLTAGGHVYTRALKVSLDPRSTATPADLAAQLDLGLKIVQQLRRAQNAHLTAAIRDLNAALAVVNSADRRPPAQAYALYEQAVRAIGKQTTPQ